MSIISENQEPNVISEFILKEAITELGPKGESGRLADEESINTSDVKHLRLEFKNILKVDNLSSFTNLVKLQLDNNLIDKIEGLENLINLEWLDLSFNRIETIENLDTLVKLTDLSLSYNKIKIISGLDKLVLLQVLTLGTNEISQLNNILYLRKFTQLKSLNLLGNPISTEDSYQSYVLSRIPQLTYLDFILTTSVMKNDARNRFLEDIEALEFQEREEQRRLKIEQQVLAQKTLELDAFVGDINNYELFDSLVEGDTSTLQLFPGMMDVYTTFRDKFVTSCCDLVTFALKEKQRRDHEISQFNLCFNEAKHLTKQQSLQNIEEFEIKKAEFEKQVHSLSDETRIESLITTMHTNIKTLWDTLILYEIQLVEQIDSIVQEFERNMNELMNGFIEQVRNYMTACRDAEIIYFERLSDVALQTLDKYNKNQIEEDLHDELIRLLVDKESLTATIASSHDNHVTKIDNVEDGMMTDSKLYVSKLLDSITAIETERNRKRIAEINNYIDNVNDMLELIEDNMKSN